MNCKTGRCESPCDDCLSGNFDCSICDEVMQEGDESDDGSSHWWCAMTYLLDNPLDSDELMALACCDCAIYGAVDEKGRCKDCAKGVAAA